MEKNKDWNCEQESGEKVVTSQSESLTRLWSWIETSSTNNWIETDLEEEEIEEKLQ